MTIDKGMGIIVTNLMPMQEAYAVIRGTSKVTEREAYEGAGYSVDNMSENAIAVEASRLEHHPKVSLRIAELRDKAISPAIITFQQALEKLTDLINDTTASRKDMMQAIDLINKMQGNYIIRTENKNINIEMDMESYFLMRMAELGIEQLVLQAIEAKGSP